MPAPAPRTPAAPIRRPLSTSGWLLLVVLLVFGFGFVASRAPSPPDQGPPTGDVLAAREAIDALTHPGPNPDALNRLPADFTALTGITPGRLTARDGTVRAVHTDGGCSTPWGDDNTKWDYAVPCKAHDLGYDLLRYAARKGHPLDQDARAALDARLSADMHAACGLNPMDSPRTCQLVATLYSAGLVINSWHQRWGPPVGDPIGPMIAGVLVIGCLLVFRMRGWLQTRRSAGLLPDEELLPPDAAPVNRWALLGVAALSLLILGESAIALAHWAGASEQSLWPLTWLAQLAPLYFFAGGHVNAAAWRAVPAVGGRYRHYLADRAGHLLRPALIFAVVALVVPMALELLGVPAGTNATVMRIALHPLWLLGVYLLTVVSAPVLLTLRRRAPAAVALTLLGLVVAGELAANLSGSAWPRYPATLCLALLAQQIAFVHADGLRPARRLLTGSAVAGLAGLVVASVVLGAPPLLLGGPGAPAALSAPTWGVLLLGMTQLSVLGLLAGPLARLGARPVVLGAARFALRAPMTVYLCFLAAMLLLVALVYLPGQLTDVFGWLVRPNTLLALALLAVPAVLVFWWFERHSADRRPLLVPGAPGRLAAVLGRAATALGIGYATLGVFGFALARFGVAAADADLLGLRLDPIQSLTHLLLGTFLLHTVRIGTSAATGTWVACAIACAPALLAAAAADRPGTTGLVLHGGTAVFATLALVATLLPTPAPRRVAS
ncbi:phospholipase A2 [Amycolatopsis sp. H20-H5]|uniref:phospholipase A2 n=1 Tax=Amycolatopsis sp. H20-H5 TaxID=3046309 RepID=UPI002DBE21C1|nr:phospholipase A2 [Amycolatopsis sp. H20-H5]MEC3978390.1 phospholipase A2 [Amycolatopsis sp. H20-H5]